MSADANLPGSTFEAHDANLVVNGPAGNHDWVNAPNLEIGTDLPTGQNDNSFGQGASEDDTTVHVGLGSIPNSKADLGKFAVASEVIQTATPQHGHVMMYLAWTRNNLSGSTNFDFELNQAEQPGMVEPTDDLVDGEGDIDLVRTEGDLLINYSLQGGGQVPTLNYREWTGTEWSAVVALAAPIAEASINTGAPIAVGTPATNPFGVAIEASAFGEAAIDLTEAGIILDQDTPNTPCAGFGSAYVKSRASQSFTSELKDFIAPIPVHLNTCGTIIIEKETVPDGDTTEFPMTLTGGPSALNKSFSLADGESDTSSNVKAGTGYDSTETAPLPTGWALTSATCDDGSDPSNIDLSAGETVTCTYTNSLQVGSLLIHKSAKHAADTDGVIDHAGVTFTITNVGETTDIDVVTDASGNACVSGLLVSSVVGAYTVTETVPTNYVSEDAVQDYTVVVGTTCPAGATQATALEFSNVPLTDVTVSVDSLVAGGTKTVIDCGDDEFTTPASGDGSLTIEDLEPTAPATTITCTVVIDP